MYSLCLIPHLEEQLGKRTGFGEERKRVREKGINVRSVEEKGKDNRLEEGKKRKKRHEGNEKKKKIKGEKKMTIDGKG